MRLYYIVISSSFLYFAADDKSFTLAYKIEFDARHVFIGEFKNKKDILSA